ncbi:MAG: hypothetical protein WA869_18315 [Alloacidobacterium sp.]|jgi:hypothetical protein
MMMMMAVVMRLCKRSGREQQNQRQKKQLFHAAILTKTKRLASVEIAAGTIAVSPLIVVQKVKRGPCPKAA